MNIAMKLTVDGLIRALRVDAQRFADHAELGMPDAGERDDTAARRGRRIRGQDIREGLHDRSRD
jgi:hypothetical protein